MIFAHQRIWRNTEINGTPCSLCRCFAVHCWVAVLAVLHRWRDVWTWLKIHSGEMETAAVAPALEPMRPRLWDPDDHIPENSPTLVGNTSPAGQAQPCWDVGPKSSWKGSDPGTVVSCSALAVGQSVGISCDLFRKALNLIRLFTSVPYLNLLDPPQEAGLLLVKPVRLYFLT